MPADPLLTAMHSVVAGLSVILWAFGTWLIPLLIGLGVWRHLIRRVPLGYDPPDRSRTTGDRTTGGPASVVTTWQSG